MSDGLNLDGFATTKPGATNNVAPQQYASAPGAAFPAKDVSTQGNAGFNAEGSSASLPISGADESDM
jgi:hypothetical protein